MRKHGLNAYSGFFKLVLRRKSGEGIQGIGRGFYNRTLKYKPFIDSASFSLVYLPVFLWKPRKQFVKLRLP
jgi:hypothetical protein